MILTADTVVYSATDLTNASKCEWALMRRLDFMLGRIAEPPAVEDDMLKRTGKLGDEHEARVLADLKLTRTVVEIERPKFELIATAAQQTEDALRSGAEVVFQGAFFDGRFLGYSDFIIRGENGLYEVYDTKLARTAKITALLQLAAYSDQMTKLGFTLGQEVHLWLGTGDLSTHKLTDILPVYRKRRARLQQIIDGRIEDTAATEWRDPRYSACGHCDSCEEQIQASRDVLLVAAMRLTQRTKLTRAGIFTIDELAIRTTPVEGMSDSTLSALRQQALVQLSPVSDLNPLAWTVAKASALAVLPLPSPGDIFFDFEGDPLHQEHGVWGLDYLFGLVDTDDTFVGFWADDLSQERQALIDFLQFLRARRSEHPTMHVYHYASYERTHLLTLAARHGVGEEEIDDLLRNNVLIDLYPIVRQGLLIGSRSYSLKKLEPLYMGDHERSGVANAADSITEYVRYAELLHSGQVDEAAAVRANIERYNEYDCLSTSRLRDWLMERVIEEQIDLAAPRDLELEIIARDPDPIYLDLLKYFEGTVAESRTADQTAIALASAAIGYHRREDKSFWWEHFSRLDGAIEDWADTRGVFVIDSVEVERDWSLVGKAKNQSRDLIVTGTVAPGSKFSISDSPFAVFDAPFPSFAPDDSATARAAHCRVTFSELGDGRFRLTEKLKKGDTSYVEFPLAVTPSAPPNAGLLISAIAEWGQKILTALPEMTPDPALDILRRVPPRIATLARGDTISSIRDSLLGLDRSYVAVQGPPGTGKTTVGSHVIAALVKDHGWKIGVVAQSHATVENMLRGLVEKAGLDPSLVAKKPRAGSETVAVPWAGDISVGMQSNGGFVVGGTSWTFASANSIPRESLDLLVIDEAGQFSLASTIAVSVAAKRLLLLGDPQQLPQVSQGTHPEPVDVSALGWLSEGHDVLPAELGYFLETSWRMHPALCAPVSQLSYDNRLQAHTSDRFLADVEPGLHPVPIRHSGNSTSSVEEAAETVALVTGLIGKQWTSEGVTRQLVQSDIIVVAPYNAQVDQIRSTLAAAGFTNISIGTVDKFQGQEAAVAIVSLAASGADDVPRGLEFLLLANRLNVAISRAQWAAYLVYSPALTEYLPTTIAGLAQLSTFIRLVESRNIPVTSP